MKVKLSNMIRLNDHYTSLFKRILAILVATIVALVTLFISSYIGYHYLTGIKTPAVMDAPTATSHLTVGERLNTVESV